LPGRTKGNYGNSQYSQYTNLGRKAAMADFKLLSHNLSGFRKATKNIRTAHALTKILNQVTLKHKSDYVTMEIT
jgi:hypothetical protein